jgi:hypothetical protein
LEEATLLLPTSGWLGSLSEIVVGVLLALTVAFGVIGIRGGFAGSSGDEPPSRIPDDLKRATQKRRGPHR